MVKSSAVSAIGATIGGNATTGLALLQHQVATLPLAKLG